MTRSVHVRRDRHRVARLITLLTVSLVAMAQEPIAATTPRGASPEPRPAWAGNTGQDQYGTWAELALSGAAQRFRWIPPGSFVMGSPAGEGDRDQDEAQHPVTLSQGFWLGETEVTRQLWQAVMGGNLNASDTALPATASWEEDQAFIAKLNAAKPGLGADLPSEAQWEYACRARTTASTYAALDTIAWYIVTTTDQYGGTPMHAVKQKTPNAWGLYDMLGNAWESTRDWYGAYPGGAITDPPGPSSGNRHVVRGGSSRNAAGCCRAAWRWAEFPGAKGFGLRLIVPSR